MGRKYEDPYPILQVPVGYPYNQGFIIFKFVYISFFVKFNNICKLLLKNYIVKLTIFKLIYFLLNDQLEIEEERMSGKFTLKYHRMKCERLVEIKDESEYNFLEIKYEKSTIITSK